MDYKIFAGFLLLLMLSTVFAAAPTLSDINVSPLVTTDHNYSNWKTPNAVTLSALVTGADLNKDGCGYAIDGSWTYPTAIDLNTDTNIISYSIITIFTDDINWGISCKNNSSETGFAPFRTIYLDANAPGLVATTTISDITITSTDVATNTGNGSGVKRIYYKLDDAAWTSSTSNPLVLTPAVGSHAVLYYVLDNLDNNSWAFTGAYSTTTWNVQSLSDCSVIVWVVPLLCILLAFWIIMRFMSGTLSMKELIGMAIAGIIGIYIIYAFSQGICVL